MMLKYGREIGLGVLFIAMTAFFGLWRYEVLDHSKTNKDLVQAQKDLKTASDTIEAYDTNIDLTEGIENGYQAQIDGLNATVKRLRKRPAKCVPVIAIAGAGQLYPEQGYGGKHAPQNGIGTEFLYDFAADAERYRIERNACKDFVNHVWESHK